MAANSHYNIQAQPPLPPAPAPSFNSTGFRHMRRKMMHMTFFWGHSAEILFTGWPDPDNPAMYGLSLVFVFLLAVLVEWLSYCSLVKPAGAKGLGPGLLRTSMYTVRSGLSYMVMLAVMSFNGGVFLAAIGGHALGFLVFGSRAFKKSGGSGHDEPSDLPPMACG